MRPRNSNVPSAFVRLDALPLTPNGKLDRKALPAPDALKLDAARAYVAPRTPVEESLAGIWAQVLRVEKVGIHDGFFELGGHSLLATQVVSRVRSALQVELPLRALFEATTVAELAERVEEAVRAGSGVKAPPLVRVQRTGALPLSYAQQRLWFLEQLEPGSAAYNMPMAVRLLGELDVRALEKSFSALVERHEALRTTFTEVEGEPVQVIAEAAELRLAVVDLSEVAEAEAEARRLAEQEAVRPFALATGPLLRVQLLRLSEQTHVLLMTMHHIVSDGWSMGVLVKEMGSLYEAFAAGEASPLKALPVQYADYAAWQRGWLKDEALETQLGYWRKQLEGAPKALELPTDRPRPVVRTARGASQPVRLSREVSEGLVALCRQEGMTPFMGLLAAFQVLLSRYARQQDVSVGSPIAGRSRSELEGLIGFFVNTLVLRTKLEGNPSFREVLGRVRETTLGAYAHQDVPFEKLVEELKPERDMSRTPLFQVMFVLQNTPELERAEGRGGEEPKLAIRPVEVEGTTAKFDLMLSLGETPHGIAGALEYSTDLFEAGTIERMVEHLGVLLRGAVANPDEAIEALPLMTEEERRKVLVEWNDRRSDYPEVSIHRLFEEQVERTPDAVAVIAGEMRLTYRELNERANRLARRLVSKGSGPEVVVGVCLDRTEALLVAVLGVLKSGGAYVPLDPAYPRVRLAYMLEDAKATVVVTQRKWAGEVEEKGAELLCLDGEDLSEESGANPQWSGQPENLAYAIYTSGSTGRPKGVALTHRSAVAFLNWARSVFSREQLSRVLFSTSVCFDLSIFEMFAPLSVGGAVVVAENALALAGLP
ncbi:MAG TPA: condensation domain-containing protein, partial [Archangium sp.]